MQGLNPREIDTKYVTAGKDARALMVEPHATGGRRRRLRVLAVRSNTPCRLAHLAAPSPVKQPIPLGSE
jgi:hypothetical protein